MPPFMGDGNFQRIYNWQTDAANGELVDATRMDTDTDDIANGLSNCITRDGQSLPTAHLPMGGFKLTGLANGASPTDSVNYGQVFSSPAFTGTPTAPTAPVGTSTTQLATTAFAAALAFLNALPAQAGVKSGRTPVTDTIAATWGMPRNSSSRLYAFRNF